MATRKEQLDAFVFARRRMVSNMVAPSPTGSDENAPRPVKTFMTSFVIGAVAIAGVVVLGVFKPGAPSGWTNGLAVDSGSGTDYVYSSQDGELHQMYNTTSAKLLLGQSFQIYDVPDSVINGPNETIGAPYGILGAPPDVPPASNVDLTQWNACEQARDATNQSAAQSRTVLEVGYGEGADQPVGKGAGLIVHDVSPSGASTAYLIYGDYKYPIKNAATAGIFVSSTVSSAAQEGPWVSDAWLSVFAQGGEITVPQVPGIGTPVPASAGQQSGGTIGDYGSINPQGGGPASYYIETATGLIEVNQFTYNVYTHGGFGGAQNVTEISNLTASSPGVASARIETGYAASLTRTSANWPAQYPTMWNDFTGVVGQDAVVCASFSGSYNPDGLPALTLFTGAALPHPLGADGGIQQPAGYNYADVIDVESGHAALFEVAANGSPTGTGGEYLLPATGTKYELAGKETITGLDGKSEQVSAAQQLGYTMAPQSVPQGFAALVQNGPVLDPAKAGETPPLPNQP